MNHRGLLVRAAAAGALLLPTAAACGIQPSGIIVVGAAPAAVAASPVLATEGLGSTQFLLYFYQNDRLTPAFRSSAQPVTQQLVLQALFAGPTAAERQAGFYTQLPQGMAAKPDAHGEEFAYLLAKSPGTAGKAQFICTMQYLDKSASIGVELADSGQLNWNGCSDTTDQFIPMPSSGSGVANATASPEN